MGALSSRRFWLVTLGALALLVGVIVSAQWIKSTPQAIAFLAQYPGTVPLPATAPVGIPAWLGWQHFFNAFFLLLILRTGWIIRSKSRPPLFWTRNDAGVVRLTGRRVRLGIYHWFHLTLDGLWVANGLMYLSLLFTTGQWVRIVPTSWEIVPNALAAALNYASLQWPTDHAWVNYNALQQLSYFGVIFLLSPVAIISGLRLSPIWPVTGRWASLQTEHGARLLHILSMYMFLAFIVIHVSLVFLTGALRNLNAMYAGNDGDSWIGALVFAASVVVMGAAWVVATPKLLGRIASMTGAVR